MLRPLASVLMALSAAHVVGAQSAAPIAPDATPMDERLRHWAWQPLAEVQPPAGGHPVDAFVDARLVAASLTRSPEAPPHAQLLASPRTNVSAASMVARAASAYSAACPADALGCSRSSSVGGGLFLSHQLTG